MKMVRDGKEELFGVEMEEQWCFSGCNFGSLGSFLLFYWSPLERCGCRHSLGLVRECFKEK